MKILLIKLLKKYNFHPKITFCHTRGFTLIEMMIVMAIISSLAALFITSFPASQRRARDARRRSDLKQYDALLRNYAIGNKGYYPGANESGIEMMCTDCTGKTLCSILGLGSTNCLIDQYDGKDKCFDNQTCIYLYQGSNCNDGTACANSFVLRAHLEGEAGWLVYCSNGSTGIVEEDTSWIDLEGFCPL